MSAASAVSNCYSTPELFLYRNLAISNYSARSRGDRYRGHLLYMVRIHDMTVTWHCCQPNDSVMLLIYMCVWSYSNLKLFLHYMVRMHDMAVAWHCSHPNDSVTLLVYMCVCGHIVACNYFYTIWLGYMTWWWYDIAAIVMSQWCWSYMCVVI